MVKALKLATGEGAISTLAVAQEDQAYMSWNDERADKQRWRGRMGSSASTDQQLEGGEDDTDGTSPAYPEPRKALRRPHGGKSSYRDQPTNVISGAMERGWSVGWFSYLTFSWPGRLLDIGSTSAALGVDDLDDIHETQKSQSLCDTLRNNWERETANNVERTAPTGASREGVALGRAIFVTCRGRLLLSGILWMALSLCTVTQALALGRLIGYFDDEHAASCEGWTYASVVVATGIATSFLRHHFMFIGEVLGMQMKISTTTMLYEKILRLRLSSLGEVTAGHLVNLTAADVGKFPFCAIYINCIWGSPLSALITLAVGLRVIGASFFAGFAALFLLIPLQALFSRKFASVRQRGAVLTDERVKLTNQVITGARVMKLSGWEPVLEKEIKRVRAEEIGVLLKAMMLRAVNDTIVFVQPAFLGCLVFGTYHLLGNELTPSKVFTTLALLNDTQLTMGNFFGLAVQTASDAWVSIKRIENILIIAENKRLEVLPREGGMGGVAGARGEQRLVDQVANDGVPYDSEEISAEIVPMSNLTVRETMSLSELRELAAAGWNDSAGTSPSPAGTPESIANDPVATNVSKQTAAAPLAESTSRPLAPTIGTTYAMSAIGPTTEGTRAPQTTLLGGHVGETTETEGGYSSSSEPPGVVADADDGTSREDLGRIYMNGACFRWTNKVDHVSNGEDSDYNRSQVHQTEASSGIALDNISLEIEPGALVGVVGAVGSAKSSLLMAVLRELSPEMPNDMGSAGSAVLGQREAELVSVVGTVAYAAQEPWIQSGTVRDNILFGRRMDRERYASVLRDCSLERDMSNLPSGDMTGIGDRGINLSGGQKARVGLARMAYAHADVYLMDDPLSAVDPAVGRELFSNVVCGRLSSRTRLLVTHQVHYLRHPAVDAIIVMDQGKIIARGSYDDLEASGIFSALERLATPSENLRKQAEMTSGQDRHRRLESSPNLNVTTAPISGSVPHDAPVSFDEKGNPDLNPRPQQQAEDHHWASQTPDNRHEPGDVDVSGTAEADGGSARTDGVGRGFPPLAQGGSRVRPSLGCDTSGSVSARGGGRTTFSPAKSLLSRLSRRTSAITSALRYQQLESPRKDEAVGNRDQDLTFATGNVIGRAAVDVHKTIRQRFGTPCVKPGIASERGYQELATPCTDAMECKEDIVLGGKEEGVISGEEVSCGAADRMRISNSTISSAASRTRVFTPVCSEEGQHPKPSEAPAELVVAEYSEAGDLQRGTYREYLKEAATVWQVVLILTLLAAGQVLVMCVTIWLAEWSRQTKEIQQRTGYLTVLVLLTLAAAVVSGLRAAITLSSLLNASHRLHDRMLKTVIGAPILFFDSNPVGRILNRFTKDVDVMDSLVPITMHDVAVCTYFVAGGTLLIFVANPWVVLSIVPSAWYCWHLQGFYIKTSRQVKRLDAVTRSPVFSQISETLDGLVTIRAFDMQRRFLKEFTERVDLNTRAYFASFSTARWLGLRLNLVAAMILLASCFFSVAVHEYGGVVDPGLLGSALLYIIQLGGYFQWAVKQLTDLENQMVSTERVLNYCRLPQEANLRSDPNNKPPDDWPENGSIEIRDMFLRYREDLPPVLKGVNVSIPGGSRVGVVGRTGAGKSSLIAALFRLVEYDRDRGLVTIDDVDISTIGLHDLRLTMSVVPQTPFLFSGSMRLNLDPFKTHSDVDMWAALEAVQMKGYVEALREGLDAAVSEGGGNLSVGQRQLLCLARAVLQQTQIIVMDEATANIDHSTDSLIQDVIRTSFSGRTVIMVAHRLNTIIDCDQVVVLSEGRVVEAGHPHQLLQAPAAAAAAAGSAAAPTPVATEHFRRMFSPEKAGAKFTPVATNDTLASMVDETGPASSGNLRRLAREAWDASERE